MAPPRSLVAASMLLLPACGLGITESALTSGTVRIVAFDAFGEPAAKADVLVHGESGALVTRGLTASDGTLEIASIDNATVTVVMHETQIPKVVTYAGGIVSFASVPIDSTLRIGRDDPTTLLTSSTAGFGRATVGRARLP